MLKDRVRLAVIGAVVLVLAVAAAAWFLVLSPRIATTAELEQEAEQVQLSNNALTVRLAKIEQLTREAPQRAQEAQTLFAQMPETAQLPEVLTQISDAATAAGIGPDGITLITASIPVSVTDPAAGGASDASSAATSLGVQLATMTIDVTVNGRPPQLQQFLTNLQSMDRTVLINSTAETDATANPNENSLTVRGTMFVLESTLPDLVANAERVIAEAQRAADAQS